MWKNDWNTFVIFGQIFKRLIIMIVIDVIYIYFKKLCQIKNNSGHNESAHMVLKKDEYKAAIGGVFFI